LDGSTLTPQQRDQLMRLLSRHRDDLAKLINRMREVGWVSGDPTFNGVLAANHALQAAVSALPAQPLSPDADRVVWQDRIGK
jgi:hypothetical protein